MSDISKQLDKTINALYDIKKDIEDHMISLYWDGAEQQKKSIRSIQSCLFWLESEVPTEISAKLRDARQLCEQAVSLMERDVRQMNDVATQAMNSGNVGADITTEEKSACGAIVTDGKDGAKYDTAKARYDLIPRELYGVAWADIEEDYYHWLIRFWQYRNIGLFRILCMTRTAVEKAGYDYLAALAAVYAYGAGIYGDRNWERGMAWSRIYNAAMRHYAARKSGEELDPESGLPHLWHEAWNVVTLYVYWMREIGTDDRPRRMRLVEGEGHD